MAHPSHGALLRRVPALALAAVLALGASSVALAQSERQAGDGAGLAAERYYSSYGTAPGAERAAERYYSSYGTPEPLEAPATAVAAAGNDGPGWTVTILAGALLAVTGAGLGAIAGRATRRPRQARA